MSQQGLPQRDFLVCWHQSTATIHHLHLHTQESIDQFNSPTMVCRHMSCCFQLDPCGECVAEKSGIGWRKGCLSWETSVKSAQYASHGRSVIWNESSRSKTCVLNETSRREKAGVRGNWRCASGCKWVDNGKAFWGWNRSFVCPDMSIVDWT